MSEPQPNKRAAVDFLRRWAPEGPWVLTAIQADSKAITTATFRPEGEVFLSKWLNTYNGKRNIYFHVNSTMTDLSKKAGRKDIKSVDWFHVDIDPRAREDLAAERARALGLLTTNLPAGVPAPTVIVFSGGGYQGFWKLEEPIEINGDLPNAEDAKRFNQRLETLFDADTCHNIDRIMRLPGTINVPDAGKVEKGRVPTLATLHEFNDLVYTLGAFDKAPADPAASAPEAGKPVRIDDAAALKQRGLPDLALKVIAHGHDPDKPGRWPSTSEPVLYVCCELVRAEFSDEEILGILTGTNWRISEHVLKQPNSATYALKQVATARHEVEIAQGQFTLNEKGVPLPSQHNIRVALYRMGFKLRYDTFADRALIDGLPGHGPTLQDESVVAIYLKVEERFKFRPGKDFFWMVVENEARLNSFNPVCDYLDGLTWDGTHRVDEWLTTYGGAESTPYTRAVGSLMMLAAVRRARQPGCKFDEMLVLISPKQGTDKSSALAALVPNADWFSDDLPLGADTKIIIERTHGRWIMEAAELKGMRKGGPDHLKAVLSRRIDRARMAYGRIPKEVPRVCVIVGTTNDTRFLTDMTGNRRYWPVRVKQFDIKAIKRDRDQLWAEAAQREAAGESIRLDRSLYDAAAKVQKQHEVDNQFTEILDRALGDAEGKIRSADCWDIVGVPADRRGQEHNVRLGEAMRALGWERKLLRFGAGPVPAYYKGAELRAIEISRGNDGRWTLAGNPNPKKTLQEEAEAADRAAKLAWVEANAAAQGGLDDEIPF